MIVFCTYCHLASCKVSAKFSLFLMAIMNPKPGGGGGGGLPYETDGTGMLVVSLRGVNFGFWSRLGCSGQSANILCHQGLV